MPNYRLDCQQGASRWTVNNFWSVDDDDAVTIGLSLRTASRSELYQEDRCLATFDCLTELGRGKIPPANDNATSNFAVNVFKMESEATYFYRRASEERKWSRYDESAAAKLAHLRKAEDFEGLARAIEAKQRRLTFHNVNASHDARLPGPM